MLCEYLGFIDTGAPITRESVNERTDIAIGDFLCYKKMSGETSCCVHLKPRASKMGISLPYAKCMNIHRIFLLNILPVGLFLIICHLYMCLRVRNIYSLKITLNSCFIFCINVISYRQNMRGSHTTQNIFWQWFQKLQ